MNKPLSVAREDFINSLVELINNSEIPTIVVEPILADTLNQVKLINKQQLENDKRLWESEMKEGEHGNDED